MPNLPQVYRFRGLDSAEEVASLRRELGPLVGGDGNLGLDVLNSKLTVAAGVPAPPRRDRPGMRAEHWEGGEAVRGGRPWRRTPGPRW